MGMSGTYYLQLTQLWLTVSIFARSVYVECLNEAHHTLSVLQIDV